MICKLAEDTSYYRVVCEEKEKQSGETRVMNGVVTMDE